MDWSTISKFLVGFIVRWLMKGVGGYLIALGYTQDSAEELLLGVVSFLVGIIISLVQQKQAINTPPPTPVTPN